MATKLFPIAATLVSQTGRALGAFTSFLFGSRFQLEDQGQVLSIEPPDLVRPLIVFKPGTPSSGDHVETWKEVESFIEENLGVCSVVVDDTLAPAIVPSTANTQMFGSVTLIGVDPLFGALLTIADGGQIRNPGQADFLNIAGAPTTVHPVVIDATGSGLFVLKNFASLGVDVGATLSVAQVSVDADIFVNYDASLINAPAPGIPVISVDNGKTLRLFFENVNRGSAFPMIATWISGPVGSFLRISHDSSISVVAQALFLGTFTEVRTEEMKALLPSSGATGARPGLPFTGETYFDTTLNRPIWWNGVAWINAQGVVV